MAFTACAERDALKPHVFTTESEACSGWSLISWSFCSKKSWILAVTMAA
jgi:hypothetical protein